MQRFKKIGVVIGLAADNSAVLSHAVSLFDANQAQISILIPTEVRLSSEQQTQVAQKIATQLPCPHQVRFIFSSPVIAIVNDARQHGLDLLIIAANDFVQKRTVKAWFFDALPQSLVRKAECPVWLVKSPIDQAAYLRIMIAVDPERKESEARALNNKLIEIGTSLARRVKAECHLVTVWKLAGESTLSGAYVRVPDLELEQLRRDAHKSQAAAFQALQQHNQSHIGDYQTHMLQGDTAEELRYFVEDRHIDLVIMGTVARSGIQGLLIGNTAERLLNQVNSAVLAIKPDGFESPVAVTAI